MLMQNLDYSPYVHFKSPLLYDWCMLIKFHPSINVFVKLMILLSVCGIQIEYTLQKSIKTQKMSHHSLHLPL
jgi:hypothetical protein